MQQLQAVLTQDAYQSLTAARGGEPLYIPKRISNYPEHELCRLIGPAQAQVLANLYGGRTVTIPKNSSYTRSKRNSEIRKLYPKKSARELAFIFDITERSVWRILSSL